MKRLGIFLLILWLCFGACLTERPALYTIGILQMNDAPTLNAAREGFIQALEENGLKDGDNINLIVKNGAGKIPDVQKMAEAFIQDNVDIIVALSTPSLQAALHATRETPIIFSSVANPYLAGAGASAEDHLSNVAGISSQGPIKQSLAFIKQILPETKRIGTLWTPSELNSNFYLELAREGATELGMEIIAVPIANSSEVLLASQVLINKNIDVIYQISDNTINDAFNALGQVAGENSLPLFGGFLLSTEHGACAALGWDFFEMGYRSGLIAIRVKNGESPADIPFQYMDQVLLHINVEVAKKQGIEFSDDVLRKANKVLYSSQDSTQENM